MNVLIGIELVGTELTVEAISYTVNIYSGMVRRNGFVGIAYTHNGYLTVPYRVEGISNITNYTIKDLSKALSMPRKASNFIREINSKAYSGKKMRFI